MAKIDTLRQQLRSAKPLSAKTLGQALREAYTLPEPEALAVVQTGNVTRLNSTVVRDTLYVDDVDFEIYDSLVTRSNFSQRVRVKGDAIRFQNCIFDGDVAIDTEKALFDGCQFKGLVQRTTRSQVEFNNCLLAFPVEERTMEGSAFCPFPDKNGKRHLAFGGEMYLSCGKECPMADCDSVDVGVGTITGNHVYTCPIHGDFGYDSDHEQAHFRDQNCSVARDGTIIADGGLGGAEPERYRFEAPMDGRMVRKRSR
jgi:hypothetical protein